MIDFSFKYVPIFTIPFLFKFLKFFFPILGIILVNFS